jgi:hypothetical protein
MRALRGIWGPLDKTNRVSATWRYACPTGHLHAYFTSNKKENVISQTRNTFTHNIYLNIYSYFFSCSLVFDCTTYNYAKMYSNFKSSCFNVEPLKMVSRARNLWDHINILLFILSLFTLVLKYGNNFKKSATSGIMWIKLKFTINK